MFKHQFWKNNFTKLTISFLKTWHEKRKVSKNEFCKKKNSDIFKMSWRHEKKK